MEVEGVHGLEAYFLATPTSPAIRKPASDGRPTVPMVSFTYSLLVLALFLAVGAEAATDELEQTRLELRAGPDNLAMLHISFPSMAGIRYELRETDDLVEWRTQSESLVGDGSEQEFVVVTQKPASYFKVKAELDVAIASAVTAITYPIQIYTPESYDNNADKYPVIYATDGQWITQGFSEAIASKGKQVILVTIEQGPGDRRATDYRLPGATEYYRFLTTELLPAVESLYRIDPGQRTFCGTSYGGLLAGLILLMDDVDAPHFQTYLSFDGSFGVHRAATAALEQARYDASPDIEATLFLTSASRFPNNDSWVTYFKNTLEAREYPSLKIIRRSFNVVHNDVAQPSFEEALDLLFD